MKKTLLFLFILISSIYLKAEVTITESGGWLESAYVKWDLIEDVDSFNVYYSGEGYTDQKIDDQLIRQYDSYYRADIPGLEAGTYTIKVAPIIDDEEGTATETGSITVLAHDRTGFAFSNGYVPGAYKADGTPKSDAVVLYITENTKNTVSLEVTGASSNPCVGLQAILDGFKKGDDDRPLIIRLVGQITDLDEMSKGDIVIENDNNSSSYITLEGIGDDATADGWGIRLKNASNVEIRNIGIMNCDSDEGDDVGLQQNNEYIWVHNCDFFYGDAGSDSDQAKGDGALDCKKSTYVTFSYNHFWDNGKCNLLGLSEDTTEGLYITYHHNWYDHSDSRHPRVRFYSAHVYNNYYDGNAKYGVGSTEGSSVFVEGNYFRNCKYPMLISMQGSDVYGDSDGTFSDEDGGIIKAYNNYMTGQTRFVAYGDDDFTDIDPTVQFDAVVVENQSDLIDDSEVESYQGGNTYNNFDTDDDIMYSYTAQEPEDAKETVITYAGRVTGGDFTYEFDNSTADESYAVDEDLKEALTSYATSLVYIQGDGDATGDAVSDDDDDDDDSDSDTTTTITEGDEIHNFTVSGLESTFYDITGNLSDSKGTVYYGDLTLTTCLKIESSTSISFSTTEESTLVLVFNDDFSDGIKIDGTSYDATDGLLSMTLDSGSHEITKDNSANLYYISVDYPDEETTSEDNSESEENESTDDSNDAEDDTTTTITSSEIHNFTLSGLESSFYSISGNLSDSKGTVEYDDITLTTCLKMESSTSVTFTTTEESTLTIVFNDDFSDAIIIDGDSYNATDGIFTISIASGSHEITKGSVSNIYYISVDYTTEATSESTSFADNLNTSGFSQNEETENKVTLYPNPVTDVLNINYSGTATEINIYNITGNLIQSVSFDATSVNMSDFANGVYLVIVKSSDQNIFKELVIKQ